MLPNQAEKVRILFTILNLLFLELDFHDNDKALLKKSRQQKVSFFPLRNLKVIIKQLFVKVKSNNIFHSL